MSQSKRRVHLFNCDNTYRLEPVEKLLDELKKKLLDQFSIHVDRVVKHTFRLAQMSEIVDNIRTLEMDMAFFVVHAHESRLSINEDNAGIGYAKIYRALLQATGGDVIIVIGGDDNYKGDDEENREVISRWAKRKVSSQFSEEYLDGGKSFIFSWKKQHRGIHEQALLHHFDPSKRGLKFEYQPPFTNQQTKVGLESQGTSAELRIPHKSKSQNFPTCTTKSSSPSKKATSAVTAVKEGQTDTYRSVVSRTWRSGRDSAWKEPSFINHRGGAGETLPSVPGKIKDLAILGCNVSHECLEEVLKVFQGIRPSLHLSDEPFVGNPPVTIVEEFLRENHFKVSLLVMDGSTASDGFNNHKAVEYQRLIGSIVDEVAIRVVILVCNRNPFDVSKKDEMKPNEFIEGIDRIEKVFVAEVNDGKLAVEKDVLVEVLRPSVTSSTSNTQVIRSSGFQRLDVNTDPSITLSNNSRGESPGKFSSERKSIHGKVVQNTQQLVRASQLPIKPPPVVALRGLARSGVICGQKGDRQIWDPEFKVPDYIQKRLLDELRDTPVMGVIIVKHTDGTPECLIDRNLQEFSLNGEIQLAPDEKLVLKTRVHNGEVSFEDVDVQFKDGDACIPQHIIDGFRVKDSKPNGDLYIISDNSERFRCVVKSENNLGKVLRTAKEDFQPLFRNQWYKIW